jgi:hypothetical protein
MSPLILFLLAAPPQLSPVPLDLSALSLAEAESLDGRLVVVSLDNLGVWDRCGRFDVYAVASDEESERGVVVPAGKDVQERAWAVGELKVIRHPRRVGESGTVFPAYTEVLVRLGCPASPETVP